jgi:hypothetical protein
MTENTPLPVLGYTNQSTAKIDLVNENKALEEQVLRQLDYMQGSCGGTILVDQRMLALGITKVQEAFMWINRAVFRPERIKLPGDEAHP